VRSPSTVTNLSLVAASLVLSLCIIETLARLGFLLPFHYFADGWWQLMWLQHREEYRSRGTEYVIDRFDPLLGWTLRENLRDVPVSEFTVNSNSRGVRGVREYAIPGPVSRVLMIGDSYTFGEGVNDDQAFGAVLERLSNREVVNMAVHGYGTDQQVLRLERDGLQYRPAIVVHGYHEEDNLRNRLRFREYAKPHFAMLNGQLQLDNLPLPPPEQFEARWHLYSLAYANVLLTRLGERRLAAENVERSKRLLERIASDARSINAIVIELFLPTPIEVERRETNHPGLYAYACGLQHVVCVDPTPAMHDRLAPTDDWRTPFKDHYIPALHETIAQELARAIASLP
jgi:hypothetical protein